MFRYHIFLFLFLAYFSINAYGDTYTDSLRLAIETERDPIKRYHAMALLAGDLIPQEMDSARILLEQSSWLAHETALPVERTAWLNLSGNYNWYTGNRDSAIVNYRITYYTDHPDVISRRSAAAVNLGALYSYKGVVDSIRYFYDRAVELFDEIGDEAGKAHVNYNLGIYYSRRNNYELALRNYLLALEYQEEIADTFSLIHTNNSIGNVYGKIDNTGSAREHYQKALDMIRFHPGHPAASSLYNNLSHLYIMNLEDFDKGLEYAEKGIAISIEQGDQQILFALYSNVGAMHYMLGEHEQTMEYLNKIKEFDPDRISAHFRARLPFFYGRTYKHLGQMEEARAFLQEAIDRSKPIGSYDNLRMSYHLLFQIDSLEGKHWQANAHLQESYRYRDSIWQKDRADRLAELQIIYETEKREMENLMLKEANELNEKIIASQQRLVILSISASALFLLLVVSLWVSRNKMKNKNRQMHTMHNHLIEKQFQITQQNKTLDSQKKELTLMNQTKDKFFSVISHDLRGPFNALLGYLDILVEDFETMDDSKKQEMISELQKTSQRAYSLTVNLLEWSKVNRGMIANEPSDVDVHKVIEKTLGLLQFSLQTKTQKVEFRNIPGRYMARVDPNLLQSVMTNLVNNAIKFTHKNGLIRIETSHNGEGIKICVQDNGIGIPAGQIDSLFKPGNEFRQTGTENEAGTGLGLITAMEFIKMMGGDLHVTSEEGKGSSFCFTLPDAPAAH